MTAGLAHDPRTPAEPTDRRRLSIGEAAEISGIPRRTLIRRVHAWITAGRTGEPRGDGLPPGSHFALPGGQEPGGEYWMYEDDAHHLRKQLNVGGDDVPTEHRIGTQEACKVTGLNHRVLMRRVRAWMRGDRSDYALRGGPIGAGVGRSLPRHWVDRRDAEALRAQLDGVAPPDRHLPPDPHDDGE